MKLVDHMWLATKELFDGGKFAVRPIEIAREYSGAENPKPWILETTCYYMAALRDLGIAQGYRITGVNETFFNPPDDTWGIYGANGVEPTSLQHCLLCLPSGRQPVVGLVHSTNGGLLFRAHQLKGWQTKAVTMANAEVKLVEYERRGWLQAGEIKAMTRDQYLALKR